ncbi:MAG: hypothetical protein ABFD69_09430 [Candidatus Sumerlaeia bacterium]
MNRALVGKIRAVRRRLMLVHAIRRALVIVYWLAIALSVLVLAERFKLPVPKLFQLIPYAAGIGAAWLVAWLIARRVSLLDSAVRADEALGLKERLSTAMLIGEPRNQAESAVVADALAHARAVRPSAVARFEFKRQLEFTCGSLAALALLFLFMPAIDPFAKAKEEKRIVAERLEAQRERAKELAEMLKETTPPDQIEKAESVANAERDLKMLAKELEEQKIDADQAQAKMEKLTDKIKNRSEEIQKQLSDASSLNSRGEGRVTNEVAKELAQGKFEEASQKMDELKQKMQEGKLTEQEKTALAQEMKALASKMGQNPELAKALSEAAAQMSQGNNNAALANMEDAVKSMQNMQSLFNEMQALDKMEYDMKGRQMAMSSSGENPGQCPQCGGKLDSEGQCQSCGYKGEGKGQGQGQGDGEGEEGMGGGKGREGTGKYTPGDTSKQGEGLGGAGKGRGGRAGTTEGQVSFEQKRIKGELVPGEIIARFKVEGKQAPGEITTKYEGLALERAQQAEDSIEHEPMPLEFKGLVRDYFAAIKRDHAKPAAKPAPAPTPGG